MKNNIQEAMNWCKNCGEVKRKNTKKYVNSIIQTTKKAYKK